MLPIRQVTSRPSNPSRFLPRSRRFPERQSPAQTPRRSLCQRVALRSQPAGGCSPRARWRSSWSRASAPQREGPAGWLGHPRHLRPPAGAACGSPAPLRAAAAAAGAVVPVGLSEAKPRGAGPGLGRRGVFGAALGFAGRSSGCRREGLARRGPNWPPAPRLCPCVWFSRGRAGAGSEGASAEGGVRFSPSRGLSRHGTQRQVPDAAPSRAGFFSVLRGNRGESPGSPLQPGGPAQPCPARAVLLTRAAPSRPRAVISLFCSVIGWKKLAAGAGPGSEFPRGRLSEAVSSCPSPRHGRVWVFFVLF